MVKKLALTSLFFSNNDTTSLSPCSPPSMSASSSTSTSWQWPSCTQARTLSFSRNDGHNAEISMRQFHHHHKHEEDEDYKTSTMNPANFLDSAEHSCLSNSSASAGINMSESLSTASEPAAGDVVADEDELIIRGLRSNRLFFEPESTSSILKATAAFDGATVMAIDSDDPYGDFRRSMEEMVMSHGVNDWGWLEEMLGWYLKANGKKTHGLIVGAFVDLLAALTSPPSPTCCSSSFMGLQVIKKGKQSDEC